MAHITRGHPGGGPASRSRTTTAPQSLTRPAIEAFGKPRGVKGSMNGLPGGVRLGQLLRGDWATAEMGRLVDAAWAVSRSSRGQVLRSVDSASSRAHWADHLGHGPHLQILGVTHRLRRLTRAISPTTRRTPQLGSAGMRATGSPAAPLWNRPSDARLGDLVGGLRPECDRSGATQRRIVLTSRRAPRTRR